MIRRWLSRLLPRRVHDVQYAHWLPIKAGAVLGIAQFQGGLLIACEGGVWHLGQASYGSSDFVIEQVL